MPCGNFRIQNKLGAFTVATQTVFVFKEAFLFTQVTICLKTSKRSLISNNYRHVYEAQNIKVIIIFGCNKDHCKVKLILLCSVNYISNQLKTYTGHTFEKHLFLPNKFNVYFSNEIQ